MEDCQRCDGTGTMIRREIVPTEYFIRHRGGYEMGQLHQFGNIERKCDQCDGTGKKK